MKPRFPFLLADAEVRSLGILVSVTITIITTVVRAMTLIHVTMTTVINAYAVV